MFSFYGGQTSVKHTNITDSLKNQTKPLCGTFRDTSVNKLHFVVKEMTTLWTEMPPELPPPWCTLSYRARGNIN